MDTYVDGKVIHLSAYHNLKIFGFRSHSLRTMSHELRTKTQDEGYLEELKVLSESVKEGTEYILFWQSIQATEISFEVEKSL